MNSQASIRVLFVEPNPVVGRSVKLYVQGFAGRAVELQTACNMDELQRHSREHWDAVMIDDGSARNGHVDLIDQANKTFATIPRISVGGQTDSLMTTCSETSIDDFFPRIQVNPAALLRSVTNLLERRRLEQGMEEQEARMTQSSHTDRVTGVWSGPYVGQRLEEAFFTAKRYQQDLTAGLFEIYEFEPMSKKYGPEVRDQVLKTIGKYARESVRATDLVGHFPPARFCIGWTNTSLSGATTSLERNKSRIDAKLFSSGQNENFTIEACYAVVPLTDEYETFESFIEACEKSLKKAVRTAPGHVEVPDPLDL